jgi:Fe-S-cluster containining protein
VTVAADVAEEVLALYRRMDEELAEIQSGCRACGNCCDFGTHGEILYASRLEREVLAMAGPPSAEKGSGTFFRDGPLGCFAKKVPDPFSADPEALVCPYRADSKCTARAFRPIGCRTYFCRGEGRARGMEFYERYRAQVANISRRAGIDWDYRRVIKALREV